MSRLPHEYIYDNTIEDYYHKFKDYFRENINNKQIIRLRHKIFKETGGLSGFYCKFPSHKFQVDCDNKCDNNFVRLVESNSLSLDDPATIMSIKTSQTFKTIYLDLLREFEVENKITITSDN